MNCMLCKSSISAHDFMSHQFLSLGSRKKEGGDCLQDLVMVAKFVFSWHTGAIAEHVSRP